MFSALNISGSGLTASKQWMEVTSNNIVNMNTTNANGIPYQRRAVLLQEISNNDFQSGLNNRQNSGSGVAVSGIVRDENVNLIYDPTHPHANEEGYVAYPVVDLVAEMTNIMVAQRMYEANTTVLNSNTRMLERILEIGQ